MMPTRLELDLAAGQARADLACLLTLVFAIEAGLGDQTAPTHWQELLKAAHWMVQRDEEAPHGTR